MSCDDRVEQLSALTDGELTPVEMAELTKHLVTCPTCTRRLAELSELRSAMAETFAEEAVSDALLSRITMELDRSELAMRSKAASPSRVVPFKSRRLKSQLVVITSSATISAIAATLVLMLLGLPRNVVDLAAVHDARLRASLASYVIQGGSPLIVSGYHVISVRHDIVAGHDAQVVTYAADSHIITLCSWAAHGEPAHGVKTATYRGTSIMYWNDGTTEYWALSDQHDEGLKNFVGSAHRDAV